jgi:non-ribosomal peptide synthetase component E (peptide arylation enzyme)
VTDARGGRGYLNNVKATENAITQDGWFKTGDIVHRDKDGFYTIVDRLKELIKYKGSQGRLGAHQLICRTHYCSNSPSSRFGERLAQPP